MEKPNNKHGIPNQIYSDWLKKANTTYSEQGNLTGSAQFSYQGKTFVLRKKGNYNDGSPRFAATPLTAKQAAQTARQQGLKAKPLTKEQLQASKAKQQTIRNQGLVPDHINEQWIVNQTKQNSTPEEWERIKQTYPLGNEPENIQALENQSINTKKTSDWKKLQKHLGQTVSNADDINALNRNLGLLKKIKSVPRYGSIMGILPDVIEAIDAQTGGAIDKTVTDIGNRLGKGLQEVGGSILNTLKDTVPLGYDPEYQ